MLPLLTLLCAITGSRRASEPEYPPLLPGGLPGKNVLMAAFRRCFSSSSLFRLRRMKKKMPPMMPATATTPTTTPAAMPAVLVDPPLLPLDLPGVGVFVVETVTTADSRQVPLLVH